MRFILIHIGVCFCFPVFPGVPLISLGSLCFQLHQSAMFPLRTVRCKSHCGIVAICFSRSNFRVSIRFPQVLAAWMSSARTWYSSLLGVASSLVLNKSCVLRDRPGRRLLDIHLAFLRSSSSQPSSCFKSRYNSGRVSTYDKCFPYSCSPLGCESSLFGPGAWLTPITATLLFIFILLYIYKDAGDSYCRMSEGIILYEIILWAQLVRIVRQTYLLLAK